VQGRAGQWVRGISLGSGVQAGCRGSLVYSRNTAHIQLAVGPVRERRIAFLEVKVEKEVKVNAFFLYCIVVQTYFNE
jgi:hypothetical protein